MDENGENVSVNDTPASEPEVPAPENVTPAAEQAAPAPEAPATEAPAPAKKPKKKRWIVAAAVVVKIVLGRYVKHVGKKVNSDSLIHSGEDATLDSIISASTLAAAAIYLIFHISLEAWLGAVIALVGVILLAKLIWGRRVRVTAGAMMFTIAGPAIYMLFMIIVTVLAYLIINVVIPLVIGAIALIVAYVCCCGG